MLCYAQPALAAAAGHSIARICYAIAMLCYAMSSPPSPPQADEEADEYLDDDFVPEDEDEAEQA